LINIAVHYDKMPPLLLLLLLMMMMMCRYKPATEDQLMKAFQTLDTEGQGFLTQEQLSKLMMEEGSRTTQSL